MSLWHKATQRRTVPAIVRAEETYNSLSYTGRAFFLFFAGLALFSSAGLIYMLNSALLVAAPARGGALVEGVLGTPRFINPILAVSDADRDLTALVYSGLLRAEPNGKYVPDLAERYEVSPDGKTYTFVLKSHATFHNGTPVTADDVVYTVTKIQDAALKSPLRASWEGVGVEAVDPHTVRFTLRVAYAPFIENLTLGIVPKALWQNVSDDEYPFSELNVTPVGSGPYKVNSIARTASGIPASYELRSFSGYALGEPYLSRLTLRFYQSEAALEEALIGGDVNSASGISPAHLASLNAAVRTTALNRVFAVFFNQNRSELLRMSEVRQALDMAIDRSDLVEQVLGGYGTPLKSPVPPVLSESGFVHSTQASAAAVQNAQQLLLSKGWKLENGVMTKTTGSGKNQKTTVLSFSLATANVPELRAAAEYLKTAWGSMGAQVDVGVYDQGDLAQNIIRPRKYDALLFGEVVGRELDLFAFWHSSQRNDPGLNIAGYANAQVDKALESLRTTTEPGMRAQLIQSFEAQIAKDTPAVFLYSPDFVYSIPNDIEGVELGFIETPSDRFLSVPEWHRETDYVWPIFAPNK